MNTATRNKRDELAEEYKKMLVPQDGYMTQRCFNAGFDAGYAIARKEAEVLVEALNELKDDVNLIHQFALKAYEQGQAE
jgi:hypothetical protein